MPVIQLQDDSGANLGGAIGAVGGFLAAQKQRKADKATATARQTTQDAAQARRDQDYHDEITANIAKGQAQTDQAKTDAANKRLQNGAYSKLLTQLYTPPPAGTTAQQWVAYVQSQVPELKLTDPELLGKLYGEAQGVLAKEQTASASKFVQGEQALPSDPVKRLSVLQKRYAIERGQPGVDTKPTQQMIVDTQKQITDAHAAAHQAAVEKRQGHHDSVIESQGERRLGIEQQNANRPRVGTGAGISPRADAIETQALGAANQKDALRIIERAGLPTKERNLARQDIMDQFKPDANRDTSGLDNAGKQALAHDMAAWAVAGMDPASQPDPSNAKYTKRSAGTPARPGGGASPGRGAHDAGGGTKKTVSLQAAMALPNNKGKSQAQVQADIESHGYTVAP